MLIPSVDVRLSQLGGAIFQSQRGDGRYRLSNRLGESDGSVTYMANRETGTGSGPVAIKVMRPDLALESDRTASLMVRKESVSLTRLNEQAPPTPFVLRLFDSGTFTVVYNGRELELLWLALEYVHGGAEGSTLEERVAHSMAQTGHAFTAHRVAHLISCTTKGLDAIHRVDVVHRNLSPRNVFCCGFGEDEVFKIGEFGMARPAGLSGTLVKTPIGTAGYAAPEVVHGESAGVDAAADVFSLGALVFFALTGEHLFTAETLTQSAVQAQMPQRRSLLDCEGTIPALREREKVCREIDNVIKLATDPEPSRRPPNGMVLRKALMMSWSRDRKSLRPTQARIASVVDREHAPTMEGWTWNVRHNPGDPRIVRSVAWESDGTALAVGAHGLEFWNGSAWLPAVATGMPGATAIRFAKRVSAGLWLIGGNGGTLAQYTREGVQKVVRATDTGVDFTMAAGDSCRVLVGEKKGATPSVYAWIDRDWLPAVKLSGVAAVCGLCRYDHERFLLVGRTEDNGGFASLYDPQKASLERVVATDSAFMACSGRAELAMGVGVGIGGHTVRIAGDNAVFRATRTPEGNDPSLLSSVAVDIDANAWATSQGKIWLQAPKADGGWRIAWQDSQWDTPFVSIFADVGMVVAMTVEGAIVEGRAITSLR